MSMLVIVLNSVVKYIARKAGREIFFKAGLWLLNREIKIKKKFFVTVLIL